MVPLGGSRPTLFQAKRKYRAEASSPSPSVKKPALSEAHQAHFCASDGGVTRPFCQATATVKPWFGSSATVVSAANTLPVADSTRL